MSTFPLFLLRTLGVTLLIGAPLSYWLGNSAAGLYGAIAMLLLGTLLLIIAEHVGNRMRGGTVPAPVLHTIDVVYLVVAFPFVFVVLHDYVLCPIFPGLGLHAADSPTACTVGWYAFALLYFLPSWILITLTVVPFRLRALLRQGKPARFITSLYVIACGIPLAMLAYVLLHIFL